MSDFQACKVWFEEADLIGDNSSGTTDPPFSLTSTSTPTTAETTNSTNDTNETHKDDSTLYPCNNSIVGSSRLDSFSSFEDFVIVDPPPTNATDSLTVDPSISSVSKP